MNTTTLILCIILFIATDFAILWWILSRKKKISSEEKQKILAHIQYLETRDIRTQVLEYDKILDACLKALHVKGESLGERMKKYVFQNNNAIWSAHKLRNQLAHEISFHPSEKEMKTAIESFKKEIRKMIQ